MLISNKYEVESLLGKGSMGEVYKVREVASGTFSALKILPSWLTDHPELLARYYHEAHAIAGLNHPNIVRIIDLDHDDELKFHYFVMEYIHGRKLSDFFEEKKTLALKEIISIARQIGSALQRAHLNAHPLIHRDIRPCNIMLEDHSARAVLMDFGIAKGLNESHMNPGKMMPDTVRYCPPEQLLDEPLDGRADIYALGMVMYEAYTGNQLFAGLTEEQIICSVSSGKGNEPPAFNDSTPIEFKALITKAIARKRTDRHHDMREFLTELETCGSLQEAIKESNKDADIRRENAQAPDQHGQKPEDEAQDHATLVHPTKHREEEAKAMQPHDAAGFQKRAERAKSDVEAVKTEADRYNAKENARTFYGRALHFQSRGEECLKKSSYREAYELFREAFRIYQDAREFAHYKSLKDDAEVLSERVKEAYDEAVKVDAKEGAPTLFKKAIEFEQKANTAFSSEDFPQANRLFRDAIENYVLARQQVIDQQKQLDMLKARKQVLKLWHRARKTGAEQLFGVEFAEALTLKEQGQHWENRQRPEEAAGYYNKAAVLFEQIHNETESLATLDQVEIIKQRLADGMDKFQPLRSWAKEAWSEADAQRGEADAAWHDKQYPLARKLYSRAQEAYNQAQQQAVAEQCAESAQTLQSRTQESQRVADHCEARAYCRTTYQNAIEAQAKGLNSLKNRKFQDAVEHFRKAGETFDRAVEERHQQLKLEIISLQRQARECRAQDHAGPLYHKGLESLLKAEEFREQSCDKRSYDSYREAYRLFKEARETTKHKMEKEEKEDVQLQPPSKTRDRQSWNEPRIKNDTEKSSQVNRLDQTIDLFEEVCTEFDRSEAEADHQSADPERAGSEDKTIVVNRYSGKQRHALSRHGGTKRRAASALAVILLVMAGLMMFDFASTRHPSVATAPRAGLSIKKIMPPEAALSLAGGHGQTFAVEVSDKQKSRPDYTWYLDGKEQAKGDRWTYTPVFNGPESASKEVKVVITDRKGHSLEKMWLVKIVPPAVNHAPRIVNKEPGEQHISLTRREAIVFSAEVSDEDPDDQLAVSWTLDGQEVSRSMAWIYEPGAEGRHEVALTVTDQAGLQDEYVWNITENTPVNNHPPRIVKTEPSEQKIELDAGAVINFSADAADDDSNGALTYTWFVDRHKQSTSNSLDYKVPSEGRHKISLKVADQDGMHTYRTWYITARKPSSACVHVNETDELCLPDSNVANQTGFKDRPATMANSTETRVNHAPGIKNTSPPGQKLDLFLGKPAYFSVEAFDNDPDDRLAYSWSLDGEEQSTNVAWPYTPETLGRHKVTLRVTDREGKQAQRTWLVNAVSPPARCVTLDAGSELCLPDPNAAFQEKSKALTMPPMTANVSAENHPPHIFRTHPFEQRVELLLGHQIVFSAEAGDPDPDDRLAYTWSLDGQPMSSHNTWLYRPDSAGRHAVDLSVTDKAGRKAQRTWHVTVGAPAAACITLEDNSELCMPVR
ncbi:MAG: protein kinase domain-containing protein [Gammaproteobacteria bacterium]